LRKNPQFENGGRKPGFLDELGPFLVVNLTNLQIFARYFKFFIFSLH